MLPRAYMTAKPLGGNPFAIIGFSDNGDGTTKAQLAAPHGLVGGELVVISGAGVPSYDTLFLPTFDTPDSFNIQTAFIQDGTGTWSYAPLNRVFTDIRADDVNPDHTLFETNDEHGLLGGEAITIVGSSQAGAHTVDEIVSTVVFKEYSGAFGGWDGPPAGFVVTAN